MAILYVTGWEGGSLPWYSTSKAAWQFSFSIMSSSASYQHRTSSGVGGNYAMLPYNAAYCIAGTVDATQSRWLHFYARPENPSPATNLSVQFAIDGAAQCTVQFLTTGSIVFLRGNTILQTNTAVFNPNVSHWFAIECIATDTGSITVYLDGNPTPVASASGDFQNSATTSGWNHFGWASSFANGGGLNQNYWYIDDIIVTDSTTGKVAEHYIYPIIPNGDTAQSDFTPSTGVNGFAVVDDIPANDSDYNSATASGNEDRYTFSNPPAAVSILCANFCARVTRDGSLTQGQISVKSGTTTVYSTAETLPASPTYYDMQYIVETDPDTGVAWTDAGVQAVEAGFKVTT
jgi:hypothetical protein